MAVVSAGVHLAGGLAGVGQAGRLEDGQCVHVCPQSDDATGRIGAAPDDTDDAGASDAFHYFVAAELPQLVGHELRCALGVIHRLGMLMDVAAPFGDLGVQFGDAVLYGHEGPLSCQLGRSTRWPGSISS